MQWTDLSVLLSGLGEEGQEGGRTNYCCGKLRYSNAAVDAAPLLLSKMIIAL